MSDGLFPPSPPPVPDPEDLAQAAAILRGGGLVAFPTETVYGLGADARDDAAVARIFAAKGRPRFNPLIVHLAGPEDAAAYVPEAGLAEEGGVARVMAAFWPGPLTLVLPRRPEAQLSLLVSAGLPTVALRCPAHPLARALLAACGLPLAAPSANPSGCLSPTTAAHVRAGLGERVDMVLDGGPCGLGLESTVLDLSDPDPSTPAVLLRPGSLTAADIAPVLGRPVVTLDEVEAAGEPGESGAVPMIPAPRAPGLLLRHYAPRARLRLNAQAAGPGESLLGFGPADAGKAGLVANLSPQGDLVEAAARLFATLHALDAQGIAALAVSPIPEEGLGRAINDRLRRAATPPECTS